MLRCIKLYYIFFPLTLHGMASYDVMIGCAAQAAIAQAEALQADAIATSMHQANTFAAYDMMIRYDHTYEPMLGQQIAQQSMVDLQSFAITDDYHVQPTIAIPSHENSLKTIVSVPAASYAEDIRERVLSRAQAPVAYRNELKLVDPYARVALREKTYRPALPKKDGHLESWRLARQANERYEFDGYSRKSIIYAIRQSDVAKKCIKRINQQLLAICQAFETAQLTGDFHGVLELLAHMHSEIEALKELRPLSYVLRPELANTIHHIEWPLLKYAVSEKDCLKPRDYEQIAWALENHFNAMHRYTHDEKITLPEGILKKTIDDHAQSFFGIFGRACKNVRYYAVYGKRDLNTIESLRATYQKMVSQKAVQQATQTQAVSSNNVAATLDYAQLRNQVQKQHEKIIQKNGTLTDSQQSRKDALSAMVQGNLTKVCKKYELSSQAQMMLEKAGCDVSRFVECEGTLIQQDTHAKFVNALNMLADARPFTLQGRLIKNGALDCAQAGNLLNKEGYVREAMLYSDLCTLVVDKVLHVADNMNPFVLGTRSLLDAATAGLHAASAHDLAQSLDTLRTNIDEFRAGFVSGTVYGATNVKGIYDGLCNTVESLGQFAQSAIAFNAEQEALTFAIESERYDDARTILAERTARIEQNAAAIDHLTGRITEFINHMPDMTPQEWRDGGFTTGDFVGREAVQLGVYKIGMTGLGKIAQGVSHTVANFEQVVHEIALSAQLTGMPAARSVANIFRQGLRVENVLTEIGSKYVSGMPAIHPEFIRSVRLTGPRAQLILDGTGNAIANTGSNLAGRTATILGRIGPWMKEAQPGYIDIIPIKPTCYKDALLAELRQFNNENLFFGSHTFLIDKKGLKHILTRHHPSFWEGVIKDDQTFLPKKMNVSDMVEIIKQVLHDNRNTLVELGTNDSYQVRSVINGVKYVVGTRGGRVGQFYIER